MMGNSRIGSIRLLAEGQENPLDRTLAG
jgi:hypothetical protein